MIAPDPDQTRQLASEPAPQAERLAITSPPCQPLGQRHAKSTPDHVVVDNLKSERTDSENDELKQLEKSALLRQPRSPCVTDCPDSSLRRSNNQPALSEFLTSPVCGLVPPRLVRH